MIGPLLRNPKSNLFYVLSKLFITFRKLDLFREKCRLIPSFSAELGLWKCRITQIHLYIASIMSSYKSIGNLAFVGSLFLGMGSGFIFPGIGMPGGLFLGMGAGFALRALLMFIGREREHEMMLRTGQLEEETFSASEHDPFAKDTYQDDPFERDSQTDKDF